MNTLAAFFLSIFGLFTSTSYATQMQITNIGSVQWVPVQANAMGPGIDTYIDMQSIRDQDNYVLVNLLNTSDSLSFRTKTAFNCATGKWMVLENISYESAFQAGKSYPIKLGNTEWNSSTGVFSIVSRMLCSGRPPEKPANNASEKSKYESFVGKPSWDFFRSPTYNKFFRSLLGVDYELFDRNMNVVAYTKLDNGYLIGSGCATHLCGIEEAIFALDTNTGNLFAEIMVNGKNFQLYGVKNIGDAPTPISAWQKQKQVKNFTPQPTLKELSFKRPGWCDKAATTVEIQICGDAELSALDASMHEEYKTAERLALDKKAFYSESRKWRTQVRDHCTTKDCLSSAYRDRTNQLRDAQQ